ncbi:branched-chain amino acid ABC transporter permease [Ruixingdingia sedimenti]|uniref:Branched-chain amino acid ABC transporter permease n=1 Tax=Ruixingdingia sedimenti TaxID=3073604 RepID=A0ABU1FEB2_9RHOB|nr:branched-chain amino acid ABC transporter permease [Xinfangfangia sp. LG-4]MDR5654804.1 branched-chain amino acid ABC transporter permease [Xinfangfangia sp. LG-4]
MDFQIALILFQDGITSGAIYTMLALGFVLIFTTTRIIFASYGDLIAYAALTLHALQNGRLPGTVFLVAVLAIVATLAEVYRLARAGAPRRIPGALVRWLALPLAPALLGFLLQGTDLPAPAEMALTVLLVLPIAPLLYRIVFQPIATASTLTLLIVALVLHYVISGLALMFFGPEGVRTAAFIRGSVNILGFHIQAQLIAVLAAAAVLSVGLALFFMKTIPGKALRATAYNRDGARLVGISTDRAGGIAFILGGFIAAIVGILIGSSVTIYYDSGLMIGLKGFVGAVLGGFVSYSMAAIGSILVGLTEAYASFFASAFKEIIVFLAIIPIVLVRVFLSRTPVEEEEEH